MHASDPSELRRYRFSFRYRYQVVTDTKLVENINLALQWEFFAFCRLLNNIDAMSVRSIQKQQSIFMIYHDRPHISIVVRKSTGPPVSPSRASNWRTKSTQKVLIYTLCTACATLWWESIGFNPSQTLWGSKPSYKLIFLPSYPAFFFSLPLISLPLHWNPARSLGSTINSQRVLGVAPANSAFWCILSFSGGLWWQWLSSNNDDE